MFKKTLIAMSIAGASLSATAGILTSDVTETAATVAAYVAPAAAVDACATVAATYSATIDENGFTPDNAAVNDTITGPVNGGTAGVYETDANTLLYTGTDACTLTINQDILVPASSATYSSEGAAANGVTITATLISGVGGFTDEDTIILTVTGGVVDEDASAGATLTAGTSAFTLLGVVDNTILFTVDTGAQLAREIVDIAGVVVTANDGADSLSVAAATQNTANVQYDTTDPTELIVLEAQYSATVDAAFDGIIDVATERLTLAVNADDALNDLNTANIGVEAINTDTLVVEVTEETTLGNLDSDEVTIVLNGDFSWMAQLDTSDDDTDITSAELATGFNYASHTDDTLAADGDDAFSEAAINADMDQLTITIDTTAGTDDVDAFHSFEFVVPGVTGELSLNEQTFTGSIVSADGDVDATIVATGTTLGSWNLNGSVVEVPYLPFGPVTQPIIRHTNTGVQTGDIAVRYMVEGEHTTWQSLGVMVEDAEPGLHNLLTPITNALAADGYDSSVSGFKVALEVTTNVPGGDVTVFAAAKVTTTDSDRLTIGAFQ